MHRNDSVAKADERRLPPRGRARSHRRGARLSLAIASLASSALVAGGVLAGPALANSPFTTHITPENTFYLLLDVSGASTQPGAPVIDWYSNGGANQKWTFQPEPAVGTNTYEIINQNSGQCLTTDNVAGHQLYQDPCSGSLTQMWSTGLTSNAFEAYGIESESTGLYVDVSGNSSSAGASIDIWYANGGRNQYFSGI